MAAVVFLRGVNVGGHRRLRPSLLAQQLRGFGAENVGAAGTLLVRRPGARAALRAALAQRLPFATAAVICEARELERLARAAPFGPAPAAAGEVRFVTIRARAGRVPPLPVHFPHPADWLVQVMGGGRPLPLWRLPAAHENNRLPGPARPVGAGTGDHAQLEHHRGGAAAADPAACARTIATMKHAD